MRRFGPIALFTLVLGTNAWSFGIEPQERNLGSEHEKITRAAIKDLGASTLSELAGNGEKPGAVGIPDDSDRGLLSLATAHCDGGDFLQGAAEGEDYAQSASTAETALAACRNFIVSHLNDAVTWAGSLAKPTVSDVAMPCRFDGKGSSAKCNVLEHLGLAFHAAQDFYSHTNWVDQPASGPITATNPPGLGNKGRSKWLDPRQKEPFPEGLISGCPGDVRLLGITIGCEYGSLPPVVGRVRVLREDLSKNTGPIGRGAGGTGTSPRGRINGNFSRAVAAAIEDTADKWDYFKEKVLQRYGRTNGARILCIVQQDSFDPKACMQVATRSRTCAQRGAAMEDVGSKDVYTPHVRATPSELARAGADFASLRNYCVIEEADLTRHSVINGGTSDSGLEHARSAAIQSLALWGSCPRELERHLPEMVSKTKQAYQEQVSKPKSDPGIERTLLSKLYSACMLDAHLRLQKR